MNIINNIFLNSLIVFLLFFTSLYLGLLAFFKDKKSSSNVIFAQFSIATAFWLVLAYLPDIPALRNLAPFIAKLNYVALLTVSFTMIELPFSFPRQRKLWWFIKYPLMFIGLVIIELTLFTNQIIKGLEYFPWGASYLDGDLAGIFYLYMMLGPLSAIIQYLFLWRKLDPREKKQVRFFIIGLTIFMLTNILIQSIVKPLIIHTDELYKIANYSAIFMIAFTGYAIVKHRFMDIRLIVIRVVTYSLSILVLGFAYTMGLFFITNQIARDVNQSFSTAIAAILAFLIAFSFQPMKRVFENLTDKIFYKQRYNPDDLLKNISHIMSSTIVLSDLTQSILDELISQIRISFGYLVLVRNSTIIWAKEAGKNVSIEFDEKEIDRLVKFSQNGQNLEKLIIFEEIPESEIKEIMRKNNITIFIPLVEKQTVIGILILGEKLSGETYTSEDVDVLKILSSEIAVSIKNSLSYEEIRRFNITLEEEVKRATTDLQKANEKLVELDTLKDEFVSVASHELRTPMTAIKSYLWMALNKTKAPLDETLKKYLDIAYISTDRLLKLVQDMLTVSRIEGGRLELKMEKLDLFETAKEIYAELKIKVDEKKIRFDLVDGIGKLYVKGDKNKLKEVFQNLIGNALKFTPKEGNITISFTLDKDLITANVKDTGPGISQENIAKLFQKFQIINSFYSRNAEVSGTGLGLYIAKQIITLHGGKIWVNSKVGEGSTFSFSLPKFIDTTSASIKTTPTLAVAAIQS